jgi:hypothetical protein
MSGRDIPRNILYRKPKKFYDIALLIHHIDVIAGTAMFSTFQCISFFIFIIVNFFLDSRIHGSYGLSHYHENKRSVFQKYFLRNESLKPYLQCHRQALNICTVSQGCKKCKA